MAASHIKVERLTTKYVSAGGRDAVWIAAIVRNNPNEYQLIRMWGARGTQLDHTAKTYPNFASAAIDYNAFERGKASRSYKEIDRDDPSFGVWDQLRRVHNVFINARPDQLPAKPVASKINTPVDGVGDTQSAASKQSGTNIPHDVDEGVEGLVAALGPGSVTPQGKRARKPAPAPAPAPRRLPGGWNDLELD